ncbi:MAG: thioesterase family protein, partial [Desulfuromonadales bacterium]|nr:thioesterase family protein [Desulfuromonadales bacterium]
MTTAFPAAFYTPLGDDHYQPTAATAGPWSAELQHGSPPCALLVHVMRRHSANHDLLLSRATVEILGPISLAPCRIKVERVRPGKQIELLRGSYYCGDKLVLV